MQRNNAIDSVKGFAILLVMLGHCIVLNGLERTDPYLYDAIKSIQMPLFMLVSGVLASYGVRKAGRGNGFVKLPHRAVSYLVPFFSWFVVVYVWTHLLSGKISMQSFATELKDLLFQTDRGLWFLMTLFLATVCTMIAQWCADCVCRKKSGNNNMGKAGIFVLVSMCFYLLFFLQSRVGNTFLSPSLMLQYFPFYLIGYVANGYGMPLYEKIREKMLRIEIGTASLMFLVFIWMVVTTDLTKPVDGIATLAYQTAVSFLGTVSVYVLVYHLAKWYEKKTENRGFLSFVGLYTLEIYVIHFRFARLLGLSEKGLALYSVEGIAWIALTFVLMSLLTFMCVWIISRIPVVSLLLFGKRHVSVFSGRLRRQS